MGNRLFLYFHYVYAKLKQRTQTHHTSIALWHMNLLIRIRIRKRDAIGLFCMPMCPLAVFFIWLIFLMFIFNFSFPYAIIFSLEIIILLFPFPDLYRSYFPFLYSFTYTLLTRLLFSIDAFVLPRLRLSDFFFAKTLSCGFHWTFFYPSPTFEFLWTLHVFDCSLLASSCLWAYTHIWNTHITSHSFSAYAFLIFLPSPSFLSFLFFLLLAIYGRLLSYSAWLPPSTSLLTDHLPSLLPYCVMLCPLYG